jgi:hypothetical protein
MNQHTPVESFLSSLVRRDRNIDEQRRITRPRTFQPPREIPPTEHPNEPFSDLLSTRLDALMSADKLSLLIIFSHIFFQFHEKLLAALRDVTSMEFNRDFNRLLSLMLFQRDFSLYGYFVNTIYLVDMYRSHNSIHLCDAIRM